MKMKGFVSAIVTALCCTIPVACSLAPDYKIPDMAVSTSYKESGEWIAAQPADDMPRGAWWKIFGDPELDVLEDMVAEANQNLKVAIAQYDEARAAVSVANADFFPTVTGSVGAIRQKESTTVANRPGVSVFNDYSLGTSATYEIDVWGRVRNAVSAATSQSEASKADLAGVELSLHAELAADYLTLRGDDAAQDVLDKTVEVDQKALTLTRDRFKGGIAPEADVDLAETQLENAKTQATEVRLQRAQLEHAIAVLTGQMPAAFNLPSVPLGKEKSPVTDPGLPSTLLERRPDIASAERLVAAANAEIGVARAAWFPTFSLTGGLGYESAATNNWLNAPSQFWSLGPSAVLTLFDAGRINALSDEAHAAYDAAVANYRQTVLSAYQDVEDNLVALHRLQEENKSQETATQAAERSLAQENDLYRGGAATYLDVSVAQNAALQAELASITIRIRRMTADVQLIRALGGGWQNSAFDSEKPHS
jgi:NodT family efflux transporter outer membrane factor (OMF) lipoprotein